MIAVPCFLVLLTIVCLLELKVRWAWIRILVLVLLILSASMLASALTRHISTGLHQSADSRRVFLLMDDLCSLSESEQYAVLDAHLKKIRKELPEALHDSGHLSYLVNSMQFVTAVTNNIDKGIIEPDAAPLPSEGAPSEGR